MSDTEEVQEIHDAHTEIISGKTDVFFKNDSYNFPGINDYKAEVVVDTCEFWSTNDDHPLERDEVVQLTIRHSQQRDFETLEGDEETIPQHAKGLGNLTPDQARSLADTLNEFADKAEEAE